MLVLSRPFPLCYHLLYKILLVTVYSYVSTATYTVQSIGLERWKVYSVADPTMLMQVTIAITQQNTRVAEEQLLQISHPSSPLFGSHWDQQRIIDWFLPEPEAIRAVTSWLRNSGITSRISQTQSNLLVFDTTVGDMERTLKTRYHLYRRDIDSSVYIGCGNYSIPARLRSHIDFITPTSPLRYSAPKRAGVVRRHRPESEKEAIRLSKRDVKQDLPLYCGDLITPACLRSLYQLPGNESVQPHPKSDMGVVQLTAAHWLPGDLDMFFRNYAGDLVGSRPTMHGINGGAWQGGFQGSVWNTEADLDVEYAMTLTSRSVLNYQIGGVGAAGLGMAPNMNSLLAAFDRSYCSNLDNSIDHLNDTLFHRSGHEPVSSRPDCGTISRLPAVLSVSYLWDEAEFPAGYHERQCLEFLKLGLLGVTVITASGDRGAAGWQGKCQDQGNKQSFSPSSPSSCPYVTSVGATQLQPNPKDRVQEVAFFKNSTRVIGSSGGGFSNVFPTPVWQQGAVRRYLEREGYTQKNITLFNRAGRGIPDIAANGRNYVTAVNGAWVTIHGTSASAPVVASLIVLLNDVRLRAGKSTVGFVNPVLYSHPWAMNDIKEGVNFGCDRPAFNAGQGWDPVTGLGTPDFEKLKGIYQALP